MTNEQLYLAIGIPSAINIGLISLLHLVLSRQIETSVGALRNEMTTGFTSIRGEMTAGFASLRSEMNARFEAAHQALLRVEGVLGRTLEALGGGGA